MEFRAGGNKILRQEFLPGRAKPQSGAYLTARLQVDSQGQFFLNDYPDYPLTVGVGCMVAPEAADLVSVVFAEEQFFITAVLCRAGEGTKIILDFKHNKVELKAAALEINVPKAVEITTEDYVLRAAKTEVYAGQANYTYKNVYTMAYSSYREIKEHDEERVRNQFVRVQETYSLKNRIGIIQADAILKIDGTQVHMG